jgi:hypothetical protein
MGKLSGVVASSVEPGTAAIGLVVALLGLAVAMNWRGLAERWMALRWPLAMIPRTMWVYHVTGAAALVIGLVWLGFGLA